MNARIGTSGWNYRHWRGVFYPPGVPVRAWLAHYAGVFDTVEVNTTFYGTPRPATVARWRAEVPRDFRFAVKMSRYLTHVKRLAPDDDSIGRFAALLASFGATLGPVLIQLPPSLAFDADRADRFFARLPPTRGPGYALETRHASWLSGAAFEVLRAHRIAWCIADSSRWRRVEAETAPFVYLRFHGPARLYTSCYDDASLARWAGRVGRFGERGITVWAYFNNDAHAHAVANARRLLELVRGASRGAGTPDLEAFEAPAARAVHGRVRLGARSGTGRGASPSKNR